MKRKRKTVKPKKTKKPKRGSSAVKRKKKPTEKKVEKEEEERVKVRLELEEKEGEDGEFDFNLDVAVDPDTPGKKPLTTHLEGQVHLCAFDSGLVTDMVHWCTQVVGKEMDVEMKGKTKAKGKVGLEGSIQHGEDQVRENGYLI